jgi:hypothetical protein
MRFCNKPEPVVATTGEAHGGAADPGRDLPLVHQGFETADLKAAKALPTTLTCEKAEQG